LTVDGESFLDEVSNLSSDRAFTSKQPSTSTHTESRCSVRDVGVVPGQQFATAQLSLIGVNSEKHRVTKRVAVQASGAEPLST
jgi:hypothetical protein